MDLKGKKIEYSRSGEEKVKSELVISSISGEEKVTSELVNPSNSGDVPDVTIYVRLEINQEDDEELSYYWYKLAEDSTILSHYFQLLQPDCHYLSTQVSLGPYIVVIGGTDYRQQEQPGRSRKLYGDLYVIDTRNPEAGWKKGPNLLSARAGAYAFVLRNTLCVFGGRWVYCHPYGEVLDLENGIWKLFKTSLVSDVSPPGFVYAHGIVVDDTNIDSSDDNSDDVYESDHPWYNYNSGNCRPHMKKLYLHGQDALYCYNFDTAIWTLVEEQVHSSTFRSASVDDVLYVMNPQLVGYSMSRRIWFDVSVSGFDNYPDALPPTDVEIRWLTPPSCLLHLGNGVLCILWARSALSTNLQLHCTKFTVMVEETSNGDLSGVAHVMSFKTYLLPPGKMIDCVAVSTSSTVTFPFVE